VSKVRAALERVYEGVPVVRPAMTAVNSTLHPPSFIGWGMSNYHALPWEDDPAWAHFNLAAEHVRERFEHGLKKDTAVTPANVDGLRWRHWVVAFCVRYACQFTAEPATLVECGVGDGLTAYFACNEAQHLGHTFTMDLYDAWAEGVNDVSAAGYGGLAQERTERNLRGFPVTFHPGRIPGTLTDDAPTSVNYLSIDLNAATPTVDALEFFVPRLAPRAAVLFDDYGHRGYADTMKAVDKFFADKPGMLLKMPTGQAIWLN
jgi:O-methyltransferase